MRQFLSCMLWLAVAANAAEAPAHVPTALAWERTVVELTADPGQERVDVAFPFKNGGAHPVTITSIESSCGCTTARLTKSTYAPGEAGEIHALFEFGDRVGPQQKVLTVTTDDAKVATHLVLRVTIPETLVVDQRVLQWRQGEPATAKPLIVHTPTRDAVVTGLSFNSTEVEASFAPLPQGGGYQVLMRPRSTAPALRYTVIIEATVAGRPRSLPVYIFVR